MDSNNKRKIMTLNKLLLISAALLFIASITISSYAWYKTQTTGTSEIYTAKWDLKLNGDNMGLNNTFNFNLKDAVWTHTANINSDDTSRVIIAPGSVGTYEIEIDASENESEIVYEITALVKMNNNQINFNEINDNISLGVYDNDVLVGNPTTGVMEAKSSKTLYLKVIWNDVDNNKANYQDLDLESNEYDIEVTVLARQKLSDTSVPICIRAMTLHKTECTWDPWTESAGCDADGYTGNNKTITYGQIGEMGTLAIGDAFDCDVNNDGFYDPETERFYYMGKQYNAYSDRFYEDGVVLIYYSNVYNGEPSNTNLPYDTEESNINGPRALLSHFPWRSQWSHPGIDYQGSTWFVTDTGTKETTKGTLPDYFRYYRPSSSYLTAGRLLKTQELQSACGISELGTFEEGQLDNCKFLMENTVYDNSENPTYGFWLENPNADYDAFVWITSGTTRTVAGADANESDVVGLRPVLLTYKYYLLY